MSDRHARAVLVAIGEASRRLAESGIESSWLDAQMLMAEAAGVPREAALTGSIDLSNEILNKFDTLIARRAMREPIAYIVGHKEFYSLDFEVNPAVLIPRPETEFVVTQALECIAAKENVRVLDIGTGSGAIAIAIAVNAASAQVTAVDISADAIAMASRNARRHRVEDRVAIGRCDCFEILDGRPALGTFDVIVSNPPYLDEAEIAALEPDVRGFEPRVALISGTGGLDILRRIAVGASVHLTEEGELIVEVGMGQAPVVAKLFEEAAMRVVAVINDFAGHPRVVRARKLAA
jgi:release factor glutamine methyltransferase